MQSPTRVLSTVAAMARPAKGVVPRWPTIAVSASTIRGSLTSAKSAGTAMRKICRSVGDKRTVVTDAACGHPQGQLVSNLAPVLCRHVDRLLGRHLPEILPPHSVRHVSAGQRPCEWQTGSAVHSGVHPLCTRRAAFCTPALGLSTRPVDNGLHV